MRIISKYSKGAYTWGSFVKIQRRHPPLRNSTNSFNRFTPWIWTSQSFTSLPKSLQVKLNLEWLKLKASKTLLLVSTWYYGKFNCFPRRPHQSHTFTHHHQWPWRPDRVARSRRFQDRCDSRFIPFDTPWAAAMLVGRWYTVYRSLGNLKMFNKHSIIQNKMIW